MRGAVLTVLGAGSILPRAGYGCAGYALRPEPGGPVTLLDCGPGSVRALGAAGIALEDVRRVVLTHFHPDHCLDLFALAFARRNPDFAAPPLEVVGPRGLDDLWERAGEALGRWVRDPDARVLECDRDFREGEALRAGDLELTCVRTGHTPEALAWRAVTRTGESVAYSGDAGPDAPLEHVATAADLFVCECSFPEAQAVEHHMTPRGAAQAATRAGCEHLLLTHFYPSHDPAEAALEAGRVFGGRVSTARDGSCWELCPA